MPTIIDVAKRANVSKSTVSRVLAGEGNVSKESRIFFIIVFVFKLIKFVS